MLKNFLTIALRHIARHKLLSGITVLCLVAGITFTLIIGVYVLNQKRINADILHVENQYLIKSKWKVKEMGLDITTLAPLAKTAKEEYPTIVKNYYRFNPVTNVISAGEKHFKENIAICDTTLISMYGFKLLHGNTHQAFANNASAVITRELAVKLFGTTDAINKTITISNTTSEQQPYTVSAVLEKMPFNSINNCIDADGYSVFVPFEGNKFFQGGGDYAGDWNNMYLLGLIELQPGKKPSDLAQPIRSLLAKYTTDNIRENLSVELAAIKDYHLEANNGSIKKMLQTLSLIAAFILLMAAINFININIGTSSYRLKEIGLRKVFGSARQQLILQFVTESLLVSLLAALIALGLYQLFIPVFDRVLHTSLTPIWEFDGYMYGLLILLFLATGILAGLYPALVLSSKNMIHAVKGKISSGKGGALFRKGLLVVQFSLAIIVFICAITVSRQVRYVFNKDIGYNKEKLLVITAFPKQWDEAGVKKMEAIRDGLKQLAVVKSASLSFEIPDRTPPGAVNFLPEGSGINQPIRITTEVADENFADTYQLGLIEGNFFENYKHSAGVSGEIVINESARKALGWKVATGKKLRLPDWKTTYTVTGVIKDFNYSTLQQGIAPLAFMHMRDMKSYRYLTVKLHVANMDKAIETVKEKWKSLSPGAPFEYSFMDQRFSYLYQSELQLQKAANIATILNLVIVLLGIFGVLSFTLARRIKEISLRKILGANVAKILLLFVKDYAWLLLIANIIAWPIAYLATDKWLQQYAYRIQQDLLPYLSVCISICILAFALIIIQCFKTANSNPVKNMRME